MVLEELLAAGALPEPPGPVPSPVDPRLRVMPGFCGFCAGLCSCDGVHNMDLWLLCLGWPLVLCGCGSFSRVVCRCCRPHLQQRDSLSSLHGLRVPQLWAGKVLASGLGSFVVEAKTGWATAWDGCKEAHLWGFGPGREGTTASQPEMGCGDILFRIRAGAAGTLVFSVLNLEAAVVRRECDGLAGAMPNKAFQVLRLVGPGLRVQAVRCHTKWRPSRWRHCLLRHREAASGRQRP